MSSSEANILNGRKREVRSILVSQPQPTIPDSPYAKLSERFNVKIDFRPFIEVKGIAFKEFRREKIEILDHSAVIFTSRNAIDHFFRVCKEARIEMPAEMKYFCISEQTAYYLQKYIVLRKRKLYTGHKTVQELTDILSKHREERFLLPCSNIRKNDIPEFLKINDFKFSEAVIYETVASDLSDLADIKYDIIAFFSPSGINSLYVNFPKFKQNETRIAAFGPSTSQAVREAGLVLDIEAPLPEAPSMTGALEMYIKGANQSK